MNFYTHFISLIFVFISLFYFHLTDKSIFHLDDKYSGKHENLTNIPMYFFHLGPGSVFFFSAMYHLCECKNEHLYFKVRKGDFSGIIFGTYFISVPVYIYGFYHVFNIALFYSITMTLLTIVVVYYCFKGENV